ncbi:ATP-binding protein [Acidovorax sp. SUPP3334]|uniref:sensor histidine kinase n=1 Tax=Acidovorax sp. SUPP3334 TaxID=2920881 RepID=UPI0023DE4B7E|nr:ATP-binding protein [Acidovorax sp. SUPP3334]GKT26200.1 histidine kinase [Acidovorax sp. SUPP3334]
MDGMSMAGEVSINDDLLWRDASLAEPLSRSWNMPRWWLLPESALHDGTNTVWVRVVGVEPLSPGLGSVRLGGAAEIAQEHAQSEWRQRTVFVFSVGLSCAVGCLFAVVWCLRRSERAFGWYALMSMAWAVYLLTVLAVSPWPFGDTLAMSRLNIAAFVLYTVCFCLFTWRFGAQALLRLERVLWAVAVASCAAVLLAPRPWVGAVFVVVLVGFVLVFFANCLQFQWHAWRPRPEGRQTPHMLLALCWMVFVVVGAHDLVVILAQWHARETWSAIAGPVTTVCMGLVLGGRLVTGMQRIERFNLELEAHVATARADLAQALEREHVQALGNAKLQERMQIAHDLHDGLGGSLVRSMALVEQTQQHMPQTRVLSLLKVLKVLRDDLRQVIDYGSSSAAVVPETPVRWAAPLRHRATQILDAMGVESAWHIAPQWQTPPSTLQCLGLTRVVEEALSNVIKHSGARRLRVELSQPSADVLCVRIEDDGVGFDVQAVQGAGLSVGMRSMAARAERIDGSLSVESRPGATVVSVTLGLAR